MKIVHTHPFSVSPEEAVRIQRELSEKVVLVGDPGDIRLIAGADASYAKADNSIFAIVVVLRFPDLTPVERVWVRREADFPYIPGLLTFREGPALLDAFARVNSVPDVIFFDGQGIAHPRGLGIASHLGVLLDTPSVGVAKKKLTGSVVEPGVKRGSQSPIISDGKLLGMAIRTKDNVKPLYISVGHRIDLNRCVELVLAASRGYRLPEPTRQAHLLSQEIRIAHSNATLADFINVGRDPGA